MHIHHLHNSVPFVFVAVWICRLHAQALTLAVLSGAAAYRYYEIRAFGPKPQAHVPSPTVAQLAEWELLTPF